MSFDTFAESLLYKNVCYACHTDFENEKNIIGDLSIARKNFFQNNKKTLRLKYDNNELGYNEKVFGVFKKRYFSWEKSVDKISLEEAVNTRDYFILITRDLNANIISKVYYNKNLTWIKTEYYNPVDSNVIRAIIEPLSNKNAIDVFILNDITNIYDKETCYPVEVNSDSEKQTLQNSEVTTPKIWVMVDNQKYIYCNKEEQAARLELTDSCDDLNDFMPEILEEPICEEQISDDDLILEVFEDEELEKIDEEYTDEFLEGMEPKEGFDISYNSENQIDYIGNFENGEKNGLGITLRKGDNATKISLWEKGVASSSVAIFDSKARLNFLGKVENSKKVGISISFDKEKETYNVIKNEDNKAIKTSIFDQMGNLIYYGQTKDGLKHGKGISFDADGNITENGIYENGQFSKNK